MKHYLFSLILCFLICAPVSAKWKAQHVVLIGLDGWGAYSVPKATGIPNIRSLMNNGCYTLKKRSVLPSESAVNWFTMFSGATPEMHGYTNWNSRVPEIPSMVLNNDGIFPTIFSELRRQYPDSEIGCLAEWDGIKYLVDTLALNYNAVASNYEKDSEQLCRMSEEYIKTKKPNFVAVIFDQIDHVGHAIGHDTPAYYETLTRVDGYVGRIIQALKDAGIFDDTIIIVTADHGGLGKSHGGKTLQEMEIPFIISGKNIKHTGVFSETMMQFDTAATMAEIFGLTTPQCWRGQSMHQVFE
ncbi:MAG: alkaline phosphatase [Prevotella sp.]|jgi:predicted AlkP superfamily pyrophosphatase or phosphodiesterase